MWFPCNPVLRRAGSDDTLDAAFAYFHAVVGNRTPVELQRTYVYGGSDLIAYLEQDAHFEFDVLPWPDYFGGLPHARLDGLRHTVMKPLPAERLGELARRVRGPLDRERLGAEPPKYLSGGRALIGRAAVGDHDISARIAASRQPAGGVGHVERGRCRCRRRGAWPSPRNPRPRRCAARGGWFREQSGIAPAIRRTR